MHIVCITNEDKRMRCYLKRNFHPSHSFKSTGLAQLIYVVSMWYTSVEMLTQIIEMIHVNSARFMYSNKTKHRELHH